MTSSLRAFAIITFAALAGVFSPAGQAHSQTLSVKDVSIEHMRLVGWANRIVTASETDPLVKNLYQSCLTAAINLGDSGLGKNDPLNDNFLCGAAVSFMKWSEKGEIAGMVCTAYGEGGVWADNYLCVPETFPFTLSFDVDGNPNYPANGGCLHLVQGIAGWDDNYLCYEGNKYNDINRQEILDKARAAFEAERTKASDAATQASASARAAQKPYSPKIGLEWTDDLSSPKADLDCLFMKQIAGAQGTLICASRSSGPANALVAPFAISATGREDCVDLPDQTGAICSRFPEKYRFVVVAPEQFSIWAQDGFECVKMTNQGGRQPWTDHGLCVVVAPAQPAAPQNTARAIVTDADPQAPATGIPPKQTPMAVATAAPSGVSGVREPAALRDAAPKDRAAVIQRIRDAQRQEIERYAQQQTERKEFDQIKSDMRNLTWQPEGTATPFCIGISDPADNIATLKNNFLCGAATEHLHWSTQGPIKNMACKRLFEAASGLAWSNNYLCAPYDFPYDMRISVAGELTNLGEGGRCLSLADNTPGWQDNYLCWAPNDLYLDNLRENRRQDAIARTGMTVPTGPVFGWDELVIEAYVGKLPLSELLDFIDEISASERHAVTPHLSDRQKHAVVAAHEVELTWSQEGPLPGHHCIQITEVQPGWDSVYLCSRQDHGLKWTNDGRLAGMKCTSFFEHNVDNKESNLWSDNFLCAPPSFEYDMLFVSDGKIRGMQDKCINLSVFRPITADNPYILEIVRLNEYNASWGDNWLCYDRDKLVSVSGHWEQATPPCPSCPEIDYSVSYGVEKGQEKSAESTFGMELSMTVGTEVDVPGAAKFSMSMTSTLSASHTSAVANSFTRTKDEEISVPCHLGAVWQWVNTAQRECSFGSACSALTARSNIIQCTVPGDDPIHDPRWSPCEPVFNDNLTSTSLRGQNAGTRSDVPGGWRCRGEGEIIIEQATYGRSCNAPLGNVTDFAAVSCLGSDMKCDIEVDMRRLGRPGGQECKHNFEVFYTCPNDGDALRQAYIDGEAGYGSNVQLRCDRDAIVEKAARPTGWVGAFSETAPRPASTAVPGVQSDAKLPYCILPMQCGAPQPLGSQGNADDYTAPYQEEDQSLLNPPALPRSEDAPTVPFGEPAVGPDNTDAAQDYAEAEPYDGGNDYTEAEPYDGGDDYAEAEPYDGGNDYAEAEPYDGGDDYVEAEPYEGGDDYAEAEPNEGGDDYAEAEPYDGGNDYAEAEPYDGGDDYAEAEPYDGGDDYAEGEPNDGGDDYAEGEPYEPIPEERPTDQLNWVQLAPVPAVDVTDGFFVGAEPDADFFEDGNTVFSFVDDGSRHGHAGIAGRRVGGIAGQPWVMTQDGRVFGGRLNGDGFVEVGSGAHDVGHGWIVSDFPRPGGFDVYYYDFGSLGWKTSQMGALRVGGTMEEPWIVNDQGDVSRWTGFEFEPVAGITAVDVGQGWALARGNGGFGHSIHYFDEALGQWTQVEGRATSIGGTRKRPVIVSAADGLPYVLQGVH